MHGALPVESVSSVERHALRRALDGQVMPDDVGHPVFQPQLLPFDLRFFKLFRLGEEVTGGEFMQALVEVVMPACKVTVLVIRLQQALPQLVRIDIHVPPPLQRSAKGIRRKVDRGGPTSRF